ncbi:hypothetical protein B0H10DRAFT_973720 [Mycena sp. CBHHK59/15]|nr:hypothetical protein B0H10DRAFT_973720 [Mycena sp. CBHHK59/15]
MNELERLLARLPGDILDTFRNESFTSNFRARNQELFIDPRWIDLDDLKSWLHAKQLSFYLVEDQSAGSLMSSSEPPFLDQSASSWVSDTSSFFQDTSDHNFPIDSFRTGSSTPSSGYSYSGFEDMYSSEFSFPVSSTPSSEFDWPSHSHTSHSSPTSEFAMLEEMTSPALYPAPPADLDPSLAPMLSAFEAAPRAPVTRPSTG